LVCVFASSSDNEAAGRHSGTPPASKDSDSLTVTTIKDSFETAKRTRDSEEKFRLLKAVRVEIARTIEELRNPRATTQDNIGGPSQVFAAAKPGHSIDSEIEARRFQLARVRAMLTSASQDSKEYRKRRKQSQTWPSPSLHWSDGWLPRLRNSRKRQQPVPIAIAIILFGVTGILESKEVSALLGGLSGVILGRVMPQGPSQPKPADSG
jgi:hypothetical protein